jgi:hypothetical protein
LPSKEDLSLHDACAVITDTISSPRLHFQPFTEIRCLAILLNNTMFILTKLNNGAISFLLGQTIFLAIMRSRNQMKRP